VIIDAIAYSLMAIGVMVVLIEVICGAPMRDG
jgi:hypothetical protein